MSASMDPNLIPDFVPINPPPPGVTSNFEHPYMGRYHRLVATIAATLTIALLFVATRLYTRIVMVRQFGWDDAMCTVAAGLTIAYEGCVLRQIKYGSVYLDWDLSLKHFLLYQFVGFIKWNAIASAIYVIAFMCIKLSVLLLFLRIFGAVHNRTRYALWALMFVITCFGIAIFFVSLFLCNPPAKLFNYNIPGTCRINTIPGTAKVLEWSTIVTDVLTIAVPIPVLIKLNLPLSQRIGIIMIMSVGLFVTAISIIRTTELYTDSKNVPAVTVSGQFQSTYYTILELNFALIAASAPALRQFFDGSSFPAIRKLTSRLSGSRSSRSGVPTSKASEGSKPEETQQGRVYDGSHAEMGISNGVVSSKGNAVAHETSSGSSVGEPKRG